MSINPLEFKYARESANLSFAEAADLLETCERTIRRYEDGESKIPPANLIALKGLSQISSKQQSNSNTFTFIDLFAGIGGFHQALHNLGAKCVFASEWDDQARNTYEHNLKHISPDLFPDNFAGDISKIDPTDIPDFDILCAGFPCQPFSQAGFKKGFNETRGTLFFNIAEILKTKRPKAFFLENVRHLLNHDDGKTFNVIKKIITKELGYSFHYKMVKASDFGLPQHRPRLFMVGFRDDADFTFPDPIELTMTMTDIFEAPCSKDIGFTLRVGGRGSKITDRRNWDSYLVNGEVIRLKSTQGLKMQGFPPNFEFPVSETQAMKQLGNSVAIPAIQHVAKNIIHELSK